MRMYDDRMNDHMEQPLDLDRLSLLTWHHIHRRVRTPFYTSLLWEGVSKHLNEEVDFQYEMEGVLYLDGELAFPEPVWERVEARVLAEMDRDPGFMSRIFSLGYGLNGRIDGLVRDVAAEDFQNVQSEDIADRLRAFVVLMEQASAFMIFPLFVERYLEERIREAVASVFPDAVASVMQSITTPVRTSSTEEAELDLFDIAARRKESEEVGTKIAAHVARFGWLKNTAMDREFYSDEEIFSKVVSLCEDDPSARKEAFLEEKRRLSEEIESYKHRLADERVSVLIDTLQEAIFFRSWRTERFYRNAFLLRDFFDEIARRIGTRDPADVFFLLSDEVVSLLRAGLPADALAIAERKKAYVMLGDGTGTRIYSGDIVTAAKERIRLFPEVAVLDALSGRGSYPGVVSGPARVILSKEDFDRMRDGDVLVAHSTTPDYVPIMKRAGAIVTDEGGVLSHASVISRELKKPCVIGTKVATRVLRDGDLVEVDAGRGVVRKIV